MLISIIIPVYNVRDYIIRCLQSVAVQTFKGSMECILIDDCGQDDSIRIAESFISCYKGPVNYRIIHHEYNRGVASARNTGIKNAQGEFVVHLDSDDWMEDDAIENLVCRQIDTGADIVSGQAVAHYSDHEELMMDPIVCDKDSLMRNMIEMTIDHVMWRRLYKKSLFVNNNVYFYDGVNIGEDHNTLPRLIYYAKKCVRLDKVVYHYNCMNENSYMRSISRTAQVKRFHSDLASINILLDFFCDKDEKCRKRLEEIKSFFLYRFVSDCYFKKDENNYNYAMKMLYLMGDDCLALVGITGIWQKCIKRTYNRYRFYNFIKTHLR